MKQFLLYFALMAAVLSCRSQDSTTKVKVMAWNILHGGNDIDNGQKNVIDIIREIDPDVLLMVETYGSGKMIANALGYNFHLIAPKGTALDDKSVNLSIFSKFPFGDTIDTEFPFYLGGKEVLINNEKIRFFANWFHYLPWNDEPEKMGMTAQELLEWEKTENKYEMIQKVLPFIKKYAAETDSIPMVFGGDMNSPSHLDWTEETKALHNGLVVPWYSTTILEDIGLIDTYRTLNSDPITHPGITWHTKGKNDDHRIDYIFYKGAQLKAVKSESYKGFLNESFSINGNVFTYPSDHGFVVTTFQL